MSELDIQIPTAFGMFLMIMSCLKIYWSINWWDLWLKIHSLRQMLRTQVLGQRNTFIYVYSNAMVGKAWPLFKAWRKNSATTRSLKTLKRSFAAMVPLFKTLNLARSFLLSSSSKISKKNMFNDVRCNEGNYFYRLSNFKVIKGRTYPPFSFK